MQTFKRHQHHLKPVNRDVLFRKVEVVNLGDVKQNKKPSFTRQIELIVKMELEVRGMVIKTRNVYESDCTKIYKQWKSSFPKSKIYKTLPSKMNFKSLMTPNFEENQ